MSNQDIDLKKLEADFNATRVIGKGKHAQVVPDHRRRRGALKRFLRLRCGPPRRQVTIITIPCSLALAAEALAKIQPVADAEQPPRDETNLNQTNNL
ncbi:MAG TPA: hypothetical protein VGM54_19675 [Chthoniobacter sp.]|jgi:site-specific recombinase XerC